MADRRKAVAGTSPVTASALEAVRQAYPDTVARAEAAARAIAARRTIIDDPTCEPAHIFRPGAGDPRP